MPDTLLGALHVWQQKFGCCASTVHECLTSGGTLQPVTAQWSALISFSDSAIIDSWPWLRSLGERRGVELLIILLSF